MAFDHKYRHPSDQRVPYEFKDAQQLINDFFADMGCILQEVGSDEADFIGILPQEKTFT
ncbi:MULTISPECIES: hypothetical protein [unclassified Janthinobacterium]|uniref:hypothetical protein n=1 Tax=unclassified Janthinobacterium TaxID=2610881 RepID=UPI00271351B8|nr:MULTISPECIES: hypothetical protein [unclassified Janthinobacterium]MDO8068596.1 hypothetical protein [Janthinobacterium sp. SUN206]MDO8073357.1 hypothetical protein [Janthinobacterium sp. SUN176]